MSVRPTLALGVAATALLVAGCSSFLGRVTRAERGWQFIQSVGGMAIGSPYRASNGWAVLPIDCDVTGLRTITVKPTMTNSGLVCAAPLVSIRSRSVYITVRTQLAQTGDLDARCPDAALGPLPAGEYFVFYSSPDGSEQPLGSIEIPDR